MNRIGYYNHNEFPVSWTTAQGQAVHELEPGQPVCDKMGLLVKPHVPELDSHVSDGTLNYATDDIKNFAEWDEIRKRQLKTSPVKHQYRVAPLDKDGEQKVMGARRTDLTPEKTTPVATVSSTDGVQEQQISANEDAKSPVVMEGVEVMNDGTFRYQGVVLDSIDALKAFQSMSKGVR